MLGLRPKSPWRHYVSAFRESLNLWAVWLPGSHIEVGDYGTLDKNCFQKKGTLREYIELEPKSVRKRKIDIILQLGRFGKIQASAAAEAKQALGPSASVHLDVSASRGVFLRIDGLTKAEFLTPIPIQRRLVQSFRERGAFWNKDWLLVHEVFSADSFTVLASQGRKSGLQVQGSVDALQQIDMGKAQGGGSMEVVGATDLNILGANGPVAIGLMRVEIEGLDQHGYQMMPSNSVRLSVFRPQDVDFVDEEDSG